MIIDELRKLKQNIESTYFCYYGNKLEEFELSYFDIQNNLNTEKALREITKYIKLLILTLSQHNTIYDQINILLEIGVFVNSKNCNEDGTIKKDNENKIDCLEDFAIISWYNWSFSNESTKIEQTTEDIKNYNPPICYVEFNKFIQLLKAEGLEISDIDFDEVKDIISSGQKVIKQITVLFNSKKNIKK